jgi:glycosyltransferase involved in cell wall biosynthesis
MTSAAVILTHNRPELLAQTVGAVAPQVDRVIVIDNASDPPVDLAGLIGLPAALLLIPVPDQPPNLAALWQRGIDTAERLGERYVAFLCDDAPPPEGWFAAVVAGMESTGAVIGCSGGSQIWVKTEPDSDIMRRMPGHAFVLDLNSGVRPDQSMHWWWCDTDLDFQGRKAGGMVTVEGFYVHNVHPNEFTASRPWAGERIHHDSMAFDAKWGFRPW